MARQAKKATFLVSVDILHGIDGAVATGAAPSKNALVERALGEELRKLRRNARRARWDEASRDPLFLKDVEAIEQDFAAADAETARQLV
ncbi:MAG: hypothetical protein ACRDIY_20610 [Chloroflexota bacterium]